MPDLRSSEEKTTLTEWNYCRSVIDACAVAILAKDLNGIITFWNEGAAGLYGYAPEEVLGQPISILLPSNRQNEAKLILERIKQGEKIDRFETVRIKKNAQSIHVSLNVSPVRGVSGEIIGASIVTRDITQSRLDDEMKELQMIEVLETISDAYFSLDTDWNFTYVNQKAEQLWQKNRRDVLGKSIWKVFPDFAKTDLYKVMEEAMQGKSAQLEVISPVLKKWIELTVYPNSTGASVYFRDISKRKRNEELLRIVVESSPIAIVLVNAQSKVLLVNSHAEELFGYSRNELVGQSLEILIPERLLPNYLEYKKLFLTQSHSLDFKSGKDFSVRTKEGSEVPIELSLSPLETEEGLYILGTIIDLSAKRRAEKTFQLVVESAPYAIVLVNEASHIVLANQQAEKYFGYSQAELIGRPIELLVPDRYKAQHPHDRKMFFADPKARSMGPGRELFAVRKDGSEIPVEIGLSPIETEQGRLVLAAIVDITARKEAEKQLIQEKKMLERTNLELDSFVYIASHDLRAPLRAIASFADFISKDYKEKLDERGQKYLDQIHKGARKMSELIDDLLTLSRLSRIHNPYEEVDVEKVVERVKNRLAWDIKNTGAELSVQPGIPAVYCDPIKITELFVNLISNAIKFSSANGGRPKIEIGYADQETQHEFYVKDNGIGIDPKYHGQIFEMFRRLHSGNEFEGTGAGLYIVKKIIESHEGELKVESTLGEGATFRFSIPKNLKERQNSNENPFPLP